MSFVRTATVAACSMTLLAPWALPSAAATPDAGKADDDVKVLYGTTDPTRLAPVRVAFCLYGPDPLSEEYRVTADALEPGEHPAGDLCEVVDVPDEPTEPLPNEIDHGSPARADDEYNPPQKPIGVVDINEVDVNNVNINVPIGVCNNNIGILTINVPVLSPHASNPCAGEATND
ncbi:hypothetical protein [Amycolatopsis anabasis]|uniref:hypothetical protein n=1 Tax=Amycolatopsis anabasis TaxID=1840409 RepID=UPI00131DAD39|nr:hypothetical protein [Amycolatopsis anabasis]